MLQDGQGNQIPFEVYRDSAYSQPLQPNQSIQLNTVNLISIGASNTAIGLYFRTISGANVPAGTYTANITLNWQWAICTVGVLGVCLWDRSFGLQQTCDPSCGPPTNWGSGKLATVAISLVVTKACRIDNLPNLDFGSLALPSQFSAVQQSFAVTCTVTEGYILSFDNGLHYQAPWRRLSNGSAFLRYNLYHNSGGLNWNATTPLATNGSGLLQNFTYQAVIDPTQANVPVGVYTDTVLLIINY